MSELFVRVLDENAWLRDVPEGERVLAANAAMYFGHKLEEESRRSASRAAAEEGSRMTGEQREAFSRLEGMLRLAVPAMIKQESNSSAKGRRGEAALDDLPAQHFGGRAGVVDCSAAAHAGDRMVGSSVLIEYKDYASTVPTKEIEKFLRDMRESSARVGVLCSFQSKFARFPDGRPSFLNEGDKIIVLLPSCGYDGDKLVVAVEWALWYVGHSSSPRGGDLHEAVLKLSTDTVGEVDALARELSQCSDHMKREIQRLDAARNHALEALRVRLQLLSDLTASKSAT